MMDPFLYNDDPDVGGDLYINLGNISEDILHSKVLKMVYLSTGLILI